MQDNAWHIRHQLHLQIANLGLHNEARNLGLHNGGPNLGLHNGAHFGAENTFEFYHLEEVVACCPPETKWDLYPKDEDFGVSLKQHMQTTENEMEKRKSFG